MEHLHNEKAVKIEIFSFKAPHMRTFHITWFSFFLCFFGWFGIAPLMAVVREELSLTQAQVGHTIIASVAVTILARLVIGWLCDRIGPRRTYSGLLLFGSLPVMLIGLSSSYESFLLFRLAIGVIGASFVITQYHTSMMFAHNVVGTANATTAGWGNLGGGVTQMVMPIFFGLFLAAGFTDAVSWRLAMIIPGAAMMIMAVVYYRFTQDYPGGNIGDLRKNGSAHALPANGLSSRGNGTGGNGFSGSGGNGGSNNGGGGNGTHSKLSRSPFLAALRDYRVWVLFLLYGACFGVELTINNIAAIYYMDYFDLSLGKAGLIAGLFGLMNLFARTAGGFLGDRFGLRFGLRGRVWFLFVIIFLEGIMLIVFSRMSLLPLAVVSMILFSLCVQMAEGASYAVVPFINKKAVGMVSGIVGAGGNAGAVLAGFLFAQEGMRYPQALLILGIIVAAVSFSALLIRFSKQEENDTKREMETSFRVHEDLHSIPAAVKHVAADTKIRRYT